jgi:putative MATE family efflux protein
VLYLASLHRDFTKGNVLRHLIRFGAPFLFSNFLQALYNVTDMLVVGNFSTVQAQAGVANGGQITNVVVMIVAGLTVGGTILVGQYYGAKREKDVSATIGTLFTVLGLLAVAFTVAIIAATDPILRLIQTPVNVMDEARAYLKICMLGNIFIFGYNAVSAVQRGLGDSTRPLIFVGIACVVNAVLDVWFVKGLGMGAAGAAWATIIAQGVSVLLAAGYLSRNKFLFDFKWRSFKIHSDKLRMILKIGLPSSLQSLVVSVSFLTLTALTNGFGDAASAAGGVVGKLNSFAILPVLAIQQSISAISAQNIGAGRYDRALESLKKGILFSFMMGALVFAVVQLMPGQLIWLFSKDPLVIENGAAYLRTFSFDYLLVPFVFSFGGLVIASGHTMFSLVLALLSSIILRIPAAWLLSGVMGLAGVGLGAPIATLGSSFLGLWFVLSGRWRENRTGIRSAEPVAMAEMEEAAAGLVPGSEGAAEPDAE